MNLNGLVKEVEDLDNGLAARVYRIDTGYSVSLFDTDAQENVGMFKIFNNVADAMAYAYTLTDTH